MAGMLTVKQVAERLNVSPSTVYDLAASGKLSCHRIGSRGRGTLRFTEAQVEAYLASTLQPAGVSPSAPPPDPPSSASGRASSGRSAGPFSELDPARLAKAWRRQG